ncbi:hypothetical protein, partial [Klebsiella michiganensis]|uniref:hypothetical protein n=1 Tax=Klebsiella michiganensis TaxID=1134687 RepID=UPI00301C8F0A
FITVSVGMVRASRCHQLNMKTYIINDSEVSRLSVAIQYDCGIRRSPSTVLKPNTSSILFKSPPATTLQQGQTASTWYVMFISITRV